DGHAVTVHVDGGRVTAVAQQAGPADLVISADAATLEDILELRRNPNEPYLFGELTVRGPERDFLRLDYIATRLCPRLARAGVPAIWRGRRRRPPWSRRAAAPQWLPSVRWACSRSSACSRVCGRWPRS